MQCSNFDLTTIVEEYDDTRSGRVNRGVIGCRHNVFTSVTRSNGERLKRRSVQQLSNARNHDANLAEAAHSINSLRRKGFPQAAHCCSFRKLLNVSGELIVTIPE